MKRALIVHNDSADDSTANFMTMEVIRPIRYSSSSNF